MVFKKILLESKQKHLQSLCPRRTAPAPVTRPDKLAWCFGCTESLPHHWWARGFLSAPACRSGRSGEGRCWRAEPFFLSVQQLSALLDRWRGTLRKGQSKGSQHRFLCSKGTPSLGMPTCLKDSQTAWAQILARPLASCVTGLSYLTSLSLVFLTCVLARTIKVLRRRDAGCIN